MTTQATAGRIKDRASGGRTGAVERTRGGGEHLRGGGEHLRSGGERPNGGNVGRRLGRWAGAQARWLGLRGRVASSGDAGMATAEYAIATIAAAGFAGLLVAVLRSDEVRGLLAGLVRTALSM